MARIVALSSLVAYGHVGLRAMVPALERFGHDVVALPTTVLSSHAAYPHIAGLPLDPATLETMASALEANGWLSSVDMVITGYLPSRAHVAFAARLIAQIRRHSLAMTYVCDPVLGDEPKGLYLPPGAATAIRDKLIPQSNIATPNAFELAWLTGQPITSLATAVSAARTLGPPAILATSIPNGPAEIASLLVEPASAHATAGRLRPKAPSGTGDLLTGLFAGHLATGVSAPEALAHAAAWLEICMEASTCSSDLIVAPLSGPSPIPLPLHTA